MVENRPKERVRPDPPGEKKVTDLLLQARVREKVDFFPLPLELRGGAVRQESLKGG